MTVSRQHGGKRPGAGRPRSEPTKTIRIPESRLYEVRRYLDQIKISRELERCPGIRFPEEDAPRLSLPLFSNRISAGFASPADDHIENMLDLNEYLVRHPAATFFLKVEGNSMLGAGIHDGDTLVVDRSLEAGNGKIVIAALNGELTVKRLESKNGVVVLLPENPDYPPISVSEDDEFVIWGVVAHVIHSV